MIDRRTMMLSLAALAACADGPRRATSRAPMNPDFGPILQSLGAGARLGVAALDTGSGRAVGHDQHGRYAMASTFKLGLAAAIFAEVDRGAIRLDQELAFGPSDMLSHAPVGEAALARGRLTFAEMCDAIVVVSDNVAANMLLRHIGGPAALTAFFRRCGDRVTRLDRYELELNSNLPGDPRDTTAPAAMVGLMQAVLTGDVLTPNMRGRLVSAMERCATGRDRLRAGLPAAWRAGDKTGTGARGASNDIGFAIPPGRPPILIASYIDAPEATPANRNAAHSQVGRVVAEAFA
jgi:beta-lactamase class A